MPAGTACPACRESYAGEAGPATCRSCGRTVCTRCAVLKPGLEKSTFYAEFSFDLPMCEPCYRNAYKIQELSGRSLSCLGVGNLSYARRFAEAALQVDAHSKYNARAVDLLERISKTQQEAKVRDAEWARSRRKLMRTPDPAWHQ